MEEILNAILKIVGIILAVGASFALEMARGYLKQLKENKKIETLIESGVAAAEQLFKKEDEDGSIRLEYVQNLLLEAGYELTEAVCAMIEGKVYELNLNARK